jgi:ABC-2 type transport system permease protein
VSIRITFGRVVRSEWTKLSSLRSTWLTLGAVALLAVGVAGAIGYGISRSVRGGSPAPALPEAIGAAFLPIDLLTLVVGVFGVLQMTGEYGSGTVRASLTAVPGRLPVLLAKAVVLAALTAAVMLPVALGAFLVCQAFLGAHGAGLGDPDVPRAILGAVASPVAVGLLGLGLGALLRNTAGAITTLVAALLVVPVLLPAALTDTLEDAIMPYVPLVAGQAMYAVGPNSAPFDTLSPAASGLVMVGWVMALLAGGAAVLNRRDA